MPTRASGFDRCFLASLGAASAIALLVALLGAKEPLAEDEPWTLATPAPAVAISPARVEDLGSLDCARCHAEVAAEWAASAHGLAWADEAYREALEDRRKPQSCHECHIPRDLVAGEPGAFRLVEDVEPRTEDLHFGVSCHSCHRGPGGAMLGPRGTPTDAHPSAASELHSDRGSDALCILCHATNVGPVIALGKDHQRSKQAERGRSCVGCHMAEVERRWANLPADAASGASEAPVRIGRSHALQTPRDPSFLRQAFDVELRRGERGLEVAIANRAGHRVPGLIGRTITFAAELRDADETVLARGELVLDTERYLPVDGELAIPLGEVASDGVSARVIGTHEDPRSETPVEFLDEGVLIRR